MLKNKLNQLPKVEAKLGVEMFGTSSCGKFNDIGMVNRCVVFEVVSNNSLSWGEQIQSEASVSLAVE
ncbi:hypothetical protein LVJ10_02170 [Providencia rettgeri]|uniref:hypothetical protein n=1 Tax=Providencia TaxID=586 RepID=UPI0008FB15CA|nr:MULTISPECIES: hypothetical protein [Providencia]APC10137.1 hypothetical protein RB151_004270 [Providencia rettgeri]AVL73776.1 hypothetical protein CEQ08_08565 [Providencia rettgeri]QLQ94145.1 hypothetical protein H0907_02160 [Providencia rettgeri]TXM55077.1 hypothetical protein FT667_13580 [Providencia rettgeri]TXM79578.1 hypothetical protein FT666_11665 [Providencia rettgeri]